MRSQLAGLRTRCTTLALLAALASLASAGPGDLIIADGSAHDLKQFTASGGYGGVFATGGLAGRNAMVYGPDGRLYVVDSVNNAVLRYNGLTGEYLGQFVTSGSGGLTDPRGLVFGPDGKLYVTNANSSGKVMRYSASGAFEVPFLLAPPYPRDIEFGPDGNIYVICEVCQDVIRFNATTGFTMGRFVDTGADGPQKPYSMEFGPDGNLYVTSSGTDDSIRRYNGTTGVFIDIFADSPLMNDPVDLAFSSDGSVLYVSCQFSNNVLAFDGATGAFISELVSPGEGGIGQLWGLTVAPCFADHDRSGFVDTDDFDSFIADFEEGSDAADFDQSGFTDTDDFDAFVQAFEIGC